MNRFKAFSFTMLAGLLSWAVCTSGATAGIREKMLLTTIRLPPGFEIGLYSDAVPGARSMALSPSGVLFVGTRQAGKVYAVLDKDKDGTADQVLTIAQGLNMPNGVAFRQGDLYVAEVGRILRFRQIEAHLEKPLPPEVVTDQYPNDMRHGARFIRFGPDGKLYVAVGAPCNVCLSDNPIFATITRINPDGSGLEIFAHGVRDSLGFDWQPGMDVLWFTDNGRDWLGDNQPPDELNRADVKGLHFGFPYCHAGTISDPKFGGAQSCSQFTPPAAQLGPHVAALGMRFYTGHMFPEPYQGQIFIAEHGSWNRTEKIGYRVTLVTVKESQVVSYVPFAQGWLEGNSAWGRPVDVQILADGSLLVSDDLNGVIYRITYKPQ
jgi:glucose/arabinose dehydrogenase